MITGAEAMMTAERLIIILTAAGTIRTDAETTEDATRKTNASMRGRGTQTERHGRVEWYMFSMVAWGRNGRQTGLFRLSDLCGVVVYTDRVLLMVNRWSTSPKPRKEHLHLTFRGPFGDYATILKLKGYFFAWLVSSLWLAVSYSLKKVQWHILKQGWKRIYDPTKLQLVGHSSWFVHLLMFCQY